MLHLIWPIRIFDPPVRATHLARINNLKKKFKVKIIFCNSYLQSCEGNPTGNRLKCFACNSFVKNIAKSTNCELIYLQKPKSNHLKNFSCHNHKLIKEKTYKAALGTIASYEVVSTEERLSLNGKKNAKLLFKSGIDYFNALKELIETQNNQGFKDISLNTFNGRYSTAVQHLFLQKFTELVTSYFYEIWGTKNPHLSINKIIHNPDYIYESCLNRSKNLSQKEIDKIAFEYFHQRWFMGGVRFGEQNFMVATKSKNKFDKPKGFKLLTIFPSSNFEYNFQPYGYKPVVQDTEITDFIKTLQKTKHKYYIIIRLHPHLQKSNLIEYQSFIFLKNLSVNNILVKVILPNEEISSLDLMKSSDYIISFASFTAVEGNYLRKRVIQIGHSRYRHFKIADRFKSGKDAAKALINKKISAKQIQGSKIFACGFIVRDKNFLNYENILGTYYVDGNRLADIFHIEKVRKSFVLVKNLLMYINKKFFLLSKKTY